MRRARIIWSDSLAEQDRGKGVGRSQVYAAEVALYHVDVEPPAEIFVERLCAIDIGNGQYHNLEFHVLTVYVIATHLVLL